MFLRLQLIAFAILLFGTNGQVTGVGPYACRTQAGISDLTACNQLNSTYYSCFSSNTASTDIQNCYCNQDVFDSIVDCESEFRLCYLNDQFDYYASADVNSWHQICDDFITYQPTTPVLSNPYTTFPTPGTDPFCTDYITPCVAWTATLSSCRDLDPSATASSFLDCACSSRLLSLASVCAYDVVTRCFQSSKALSDVQLWKICGQTYSKGTIITATDSMFGSSISPSLSASTRPGPTSTVSQTSSATTSSISSSVATISSQASSSSASPTSATSSNASSSDANASGRGPGFIRSVTWFVITAVWILINWV